MPWGSTVFPLLIVTASGGFTGFFVYSPGPGHGNLIVSIAAKAGTDPFGNPYPAGLASYNGHGAVISLLSTTNSAFFEYANLGTSTQGQLISALSSAAGTDPVAGFAYNAGLYGLDPVGGNLTVAGPVISFGETSYTRSASIKPVIPGSGAAQPLLQLDAPEQTSASHLQMLMTGESPDTTKMAQLLVGRVSGAAVLAPVTVAMLEVQGPAALTNQAAPPSGVAGAVYVYANTSGIPAAVTQAGNFINLSGSALADTTAHTVTAASLTTITTAWSIPATDAVVNSIYRVQALGHGTQGTTVQNLFLAGAVAGGTFLAEVEFAFAGIPISTAFTWEATMTIVVKSAGAGGTVDITLRASVGFGATATAGFAQVGQSRASAFNTTTAETAAIQAQWGSTTGAPTVTCDENWIERIA